MDDAKNFLSALDDETLLRKQKSIRRKLLEQLGENFLPKRIAILNGSTTNDIKNILEIFLLGEGIKPAFYESDYNKFFEDAVFENPALENFQPEIIIVFTSVVNILNLPQLDDTPAEVDEKLSAEFQRFKIIWENLSSKYNAIIVQNNFDAPCTQPEGNLDSFLPQSLSRFVARLNEKFADYATSHAGFYLNDINRLAAEVGLSRWHNRAQYHAYKFAMDYDIFPAVAKNLKRVICAALGKVKKCLVLDLDNTLWGGVIGEDGVAGISLGNETAEGEAYTEFQKYVKRLKNRGIILAVCSKNDEDVAKSGFSHPDSVLTLEDFAIFLANWEPKNLNVAKISRELNIGLDSLVFLDDSPAEREIVRKNLPEVAVPEIDSADVFSYIRALEAEGYFDTLAISADDKRRGDFYRENQNRIAARENFSDYNEFLKSLEMTAEIFPFKEIYFDRIAQLTNKTNQFNLTTRRFTRAQIQQMAEDENFLTLCCRLKDKFGDNGIISVIVGEKKNSELRIILWLMSCRVLKRGVEDAMLNFLVDAAKNIGVEKITGYYFPTNKNKMVAELYKNFGFEKISDGVWNLRLADFLPRENFIVVGGD